jgi:hypothetical protein
VKLRRPRTVIFGPYPPIPGAVSAATLEEVRRLLASGHEVRVVSPAPSAAHEHADLQRLEGAVKFGRLALRAQHLVVHLDAALLASARHRQELPARLALAAALRSAGRSTVYLPRGVDPPSDGWAGLVLQAADEVLTEAEESPAGVPEAIRSGSAPTGRPDGAPWNFGPDPSREEVETEIRRRAAARRAIGPLPGAAGASSRSGRPAVRSLQALPILGAAPARSANPLIATVKRTIQRLVAWQIDPVIEHVNLLQRVVAEAVDPETDPGSAEVVHPT